MSFDPLKFAGQFRYRLPSEKKNLSWCPKPKSKNTDAKIVMFALKNYFLKYKNQLIFTHTHTHIYITLFIGVSK